MEVTCSNCKNIIRLDKTGMESALNNLSGGWHNLTCPSCKKTMMITRSLIEEGLKKATTVAEPVRLTGLEKRKAEAEKEERKEKQKRQEKQRKQVEKKQKK